MRPVQRHLAAVLALIGLAVSSFLRFRRSGPTPLRTDRRKDEQRGSGLPIMVVGMNKAGTTTIRDYFRCGGMNTSHYFCGRHNGFPLCADVIKENIENGRPPLSGKTMEWDVFAEINNHKICYYPQMESLSEIHEQYPNSTFVLNLRNVTQWASSVRRWGHGPTRLPTKLVECDLPGLPAGVGSKDEELESWFEMHVKHVREFVSRHPSHRLVEVSIDSEEAGRTMEENFGISADCWGHSNKSRKKATRAEHSVQSASTNHTCHPPNDFTKIPQTREKHKVDWGKVCAPDVFPTEKIPAFVLIGAQKAGTTVFFKTCTKHPLIHKPPWKEFHMLAGRNMLDPEADLDAWKRNYRFMFGKATSGCPSCITGEATPQYMKFPNTVISKLRSIGPWVKIVVLLRDPIARALSSFKMRMRSRRKGTKHSLTFEEIVREDFAKMKVAGLLQNWTDDQGWVDFETFAGSDDEENALQRFEEQELEIGFSDRGGVITSGVIFRGMYELLLRQWIRAFGAENVLVINTDRERVGPEVCGRFHEFLGLDAVNISRSLAEKDHSPENKEERNETGDHKEEVEEYSSLVSREMVSKLKKFYSPYNQRLENLLGDEWAGDVWGYT